MSIAINDTITLFNGATLEKFQPLSLVDFDAIADSMLDWGGVYLAGGETRIEFVFGVRQKMLSILDFIYPTSKAPLVWNGKGARFAFNGEWIGYVANEARAEKCNFICVGANAGSVTIIHEGCRMTIANTVDDKIPR